MIELTIDRLRLRVDNAAGHEHRLELVARLAASLVADRLALGALAPAAGSQRAGPAVSVNLSAMTDAVAAERIAGAWLAALGPLAARPGRPPEARR
jgi:hypothetical protein